MHFENQDVGERCDGSSVATVSRVAVFDSDSRRTHALDYRLAVRGCVVLYWSRTVLRRDVAWLRERRYRIVNLDTSRWLNEHDMHTSLAIALNFPDYYGHNLDALTDCLGDVADGDYGWSAKDEGLVLIMEGFDQFIRRETRAGHHLLDVFAGQARTASLVGNRMLCLVQSDDPDLKLEPIGATAVGWNDSEWLDSNRHP